jgi:hypothetical protein
MHRPLKISHRRAFSRDKTSRRQDILTHSKRRRTVAVTRMRLGPVSLRVRRLEGRCLQGSYLVLLALFSGC